MKKFISGLLVGILISTLAVGYAAVEFDVKLADFPILVNGKVFTTDKPIVTINDSTYLPLRAIGEALGVKVNWNSELNRAEIGETPAEEPAGDSYSYSNPAPVNVAQTLEVDNIFDNYKVEMSVTDIIRGDLAWDMISNANMFNDPPDEGYEYILAKVYIKLLDMADDQALDVNGVVDISLISGEGSEYDYTTVVCPDPELDATLYKGASNEGWAAFMVKKDDLYPKLTYGRDYDGTGGIWFKAYKD